MKLVRSSSLPVAVTFTLSARTHLQHMYTWYLLYLPVFRNPRFLTRKFLCLSSVYACMYKSKAAQGF